MQHVDTIIDKKHGLKQIWTAFFSGENNMLDTVIYYRHKFSQIQIDSNINQNEIKHKKMRNLKVIDMSVKETGSDERH